MMTEIHASSRPRSSKEGLEEAPSEGPMAKKHAGDKKIGDKKKQKDKKRTLKRL